MVIGVGMKELDLDLFDVQAYLDDKGIEYSHSGNKNVSSGWIGVSCIFCGDTSNHLGINLVSHKYSCFKCGTKGGLLFFISQIEKCSLNYTKKIIAQYVNKDTTRLKSPEKITSSKTMLPNNVTNNFLPLHDKFLSKRGYNRKELQRQYDIMAIGPTLDEWKFRIFIPIYYKQELVSYVGRDITGKARIPYKNSPIEKSKISVKNMLYGLDNTKDKLILVEGIFDAWRIGFGAVATLGTQVTTEQLALLQNYKKIGIMFDADATNKAVKLAHTLGSIVPEVCVFELATGDPDSILNENDVWELKREFFS